MRKDSQRVVYYSDELNDEFSGPVIKPRVIDKDYVYIKKGFFANLSHFFWYRIIATPLAYIATKLKFHHKIVNKKVFKKLKNYEGYFIYGNHTQQLGDAIIPSMLSFPKASYVIVHPSNMEIKGLKHIIDKLGALPLPSDMDSTRNFLEAIEKRSVQGNAVVIYPEAHIWPYYTHIRPFKSVSFRYPIKYKTATFCFTNTYQKRKFSKKPKIVTYIDGPFYPNSNLSTKEQEKDLRDQVYNTMVERSKMNTVEKIKYIRGNTND